MESKLNLDVKLVSEARAHAARVADDVQMCIRDSLNIEPSDFFDLNQRFPEKLIPLIADLECLDEEELNHIAAIVKSMKK